MKLLFFVLIFPFFSQAQEARLFCDDPYSGTLREVDNQLVPQIDSCVADLVWGAENICLEGSLQALVERINSGDYRWPYLYAEEAKINPLDDQSVVFVSVDQKSFISSQKEIQLCD